MNAKDTVMDELEMRIVLNEASWKSPTIPFSYHSAIAKAQAEISFKAGEKEMFEKLRQALRGEPTVFDYALDAFEIQWIYEHSKEPN